MPEGIAATTSSHEYPEACTKYAPITGRVPSPSPAAHSGHLCFSITDV